MFYPYGMNPLPQPTSTNPLAMLMQMRSDPVGCVRRAGYNIPEGMSSPQQMLQYLMQSGQVPQARVQQVQQMASMFFGR